MKSDLNIKDYKHVIWDWNGTLFNDIHLCADIMNHLLKSRYLPVLSLEKYREIFTFPVKDYYIRAGHTFETESFEKIGKEFMDEYEIRKYECGLFPFAEDVLRKLNSLNIRQYLLSAYKQDSLSHIIQKYNIDNYFTSVCGLDHIYADGKLGLGKKLLNEIQSNGRLTDGVLLIGDTKHDYEVADHLNIDCLLIGSGHQDESKLKDLDAYYLNSMEELYQLLNN